MREPWGRAQLGARGPRVSALALASSYGVTGHGVERAFERGVDFFFWGALRRRDFGASLRALASRHRDRMTIAVQSFVKSPSLIPWSVESARLRLRVDAIDILCLAFRNEGLDARTLDVARNLVDRGRVRSLMVSSHDHATLIELAREPALDSLMIRYNAAHRRVEDEVFAVLPPQRPAIAMGAAPPNPRERLRPLRFASRPSIVAYTATRWGSLLDPASLEATEPRPRGSDCYRFVLSHASVDACLFGPANDAELDEALAAIDRGPMNADELAWMSRVGDAVHAHRMAAPPLGARDYVRHAAEMIRTIARDGITENLVSRFNR